MRHTIVFVFGILIVSGLFIFDNRAAAAPTSVDEKIAVLEAEIAAKQAQIRDLRKRSPESGAKAKRQKAVASLALVNDFEMYYGRYLREKGYEREVARQETPAKLDPCDPQRLFIRADSLDNYLYGITPTGKAKGASISWMDDREADVVTTKIGGMMSYVLLRDLCPVTPVGSAPFVSGYALAPYIYGNGSLTSPQSKKEQSVAKIGVEAQLEISRMPLVQRHVFTLAPYYLTDFRGQARASGLEAFWDLYDANLHLGGYINTNPYLGWFIQLRGIADVRRVDNVGLTGLAATDYAWVGGTARLNMFFFPLTGGEFLQNRFSLIASADWFQDTVSNVIVRKYGVTLSYKLSPAGNSALALEYAYGTDKDSLDKANQYLAKLTFAY